jgi:SAM-dependent methyltransferase
VPSEQLTGLDIEAPLMELGYEFFLDRETLKSKFLVADIFKGAEQGEPWTSLEKEKADIIHCSAFFHLFPLPDQIRAAKNVARLVRPNGIIVGRQSGSVKPGEVPAIAEGSTSFRHDISSLQSMWDEVGRATDTEWKVSGTLDTVGMIAKKNAVEDENSRRLLFTITRVR